MLNFAVRRPAHRPWMMVVAGATLGLLAFAADAFDGNAGRVVTALVSSGLAWGAAALLAGWTASDRRGAVAKATVLLVSATLVYYLLILLVSRRWAGGDPADGYGLRSLAVMTTAWLLVSIVAGPLLGLLGHLTRTAPVPSAALAAGVACGLLSGQGWQEMTVIASIDGPDLVLPRGIDLAGLIQVVLPLALLAWMAARRRLWRSWPALVVATVVAATLCGMGWVGVHVAANQVG